MLKRCFLIIICLMIFPATSIYSERKDIKVFRGVVTLHNIPAKVIHVNKIIKNPRPGTSYIGDEGILVEADKIPEVMANWTIVKVKYYQYPAPKIIKYKIFWEEKEVTVKYRAVSVEIVGDLSLYMKE